MKNAIVTLVVGKKYEEMVNVYCKDNWQKYCEIFDYDLIVIKELLDKSNRARERSVAWQKLLILSQEWSDNYDQIVWIDTDIIINYKQAKDITSHVPLEKVGAVEEYSIPSKILHGISQKRLFDYWKKFNVPYIDNLTPGEYYKNRGIPGGDLKEVVQTGVFVCSAKYHRKIFEHIYYNYEEINRNPEWNYEMPAMSYELLKSNLVKWIPNEYNYCVFLIISSYYSFLFFKNPIIQKIYNKLIKLFGIKNYYNLTSAQTKCLDQIYKNGYFIHYAGCHEWIKYKKVE